MEIYYDFSIEQFDKWNQQEPAQSSNGEYSMELANLDQQSTTSTTIYHHEPSKYSSNLAKFYDFKEEEMPSFNHQNHSEQTKIQNFDQQSCLNITDLKKNLMHFQQQQHNQYIDPIQESNISVNQSINENCNNFAKKGGCFVLNKNNSKKIHKDKPNNNRNQDKNKNKNGNNSSYVNETKNLPFLIGNYLLKVLKKKLVQNQEVQNIQKIKSIQDLKKLFNISEEVKILCVLYLTGGGLARQIGNSQRIKQKKLAYKYIDIVVKGCIDTENFQCFIKKNE